MKKLTLLLVGAVVLFFVAFATPKAEAHGYRSRVISVCPYCRKNVYAYYKPVVYYGVKRYTWVPSYHTSCAQRYYRRPSYGYSYYPRVPYNYGYRYGYGYGYGYSRPGFSITIRR